MSLGPGVFLRYRHSPEDFMLIFVAVPLAFAGFFWWRQRAFARYYGMMIRQLTATRRGVRSADPAALPIDGREAVGRLLRESIARGHSLSAALAQCIQWLRTDVVQGQKANRLRLLWMMRMLVVVSFVIAARILFCGRPSGVINGVSPVDATLLLVASTLLLAGSWLFFRLVPVLEVSTDGAISGLHDWLRHRINADNACSGASIPALYAIEEEEFRTGVSMREEKIEVLNDMWRARISKVEAGSETAGELMPVAEFFVFGVFLVSATCVPLLADLF